nr:hypothetical protein [Candidatus Dadabacteria bacterium]NIV42214.1 hypothetical protein [Candidatus Dadabacteria bacterium]NIX14750.1 hypothetical protein [Candidatus Dadabacteria bacterium]
CKCFTDLITSRQINDGLQLYIDTYRDEYIKLMRKKIGLVIPAEQDWQLVEIILECLYSSQVDYTTFFRKLSEFDIENFKTENQVSKMFSGTDYGKWAAFYSKRIKEEQSSKQARKELMNSVNPKYILRNYIAQIAIEKAQAGDYSEINMVYNILKNPFDEQPEFEEYSKTAPEEYRNLSLSCSA